MDPFPAPAVVAAVVVVAVAAAQAVVDAVAELVVDRIATVGTVVESAAVVGQTAVVSDSWYDRIAKTAESEVVAWGWPDARVVSVHTRLGTMSSGTVSVEVAVVDSAVAAFGPERLRYCCSGRGWAAERLPFRPGVGSDFGEVWWVV